jgi:hypothetical protein
MEKRAFSRLEIPVPTPKPKWQRIVSNTFYTFCRSHKGMVDYGQQVVFYLRQ